MIRASGLFAVST